MFSKDKLFISINALVSGIPYGDFNEKLLELLPEMQFEARFILSGKMSAQQYLDTISFFTCVISEFYRDDELETIYGSTLQDSIDTIDQVKAIYKNKFL